MKKLFILISMAFTTSVAMAQIADASVYADCSKNGYSKAITGTAAVNSSAGRTSCDYVQLWAGGPNWATFNVGATITDYAKLTIGADSTSYADNTDQAPYYNTANVGGLYVWEYPNFNGRKTTTDENVFTVPSDVATTLWGSNWKTPTEEQLATLCDKNGTYGKTTWTWCDGSTTQYVAGCTLKGYKVSGVGEYASYSIFLPAAGYFYYDDGAVHAASYYGCYWSSTEYLGLGLDHYIIHLDFWSDNREINMYGYKFGYSVRAVLDDNVAMQAANQVTLTLKAEGCSAPNVIICPAGQQLRINAVDTNDYHFAQWTDGNTANPRVVTMNSNATYTALFAMICDGKCGDNLYWQYSNGILNITGSGTMYEEKPWFLFADSITQVCLPNGLTTIDAGRFQNMSKLNSIVIPASVTSIGANAFAGCRKLYDIYCLAVEPPVAQTSSLENYNVYLHVPCDNLKDYQMDAVLGSFKYIECIGAEETPATDVSVTPSTNSADITWPKNDNAADYSIEIKKDGVVFCTLTFNAQGQLKSIAFAPGRDGGREVPAAVETASGYKFTITGLNPSTTYTYKIDTKNAGGATLANYTGQFTTTSLTALDQFPDSPVDQITKMIKDGQLYIMRDGKMYNAQGGKL